MKYRVGYFIQEIQFILRKIIEQDAFIRALIDTANDKPKGFISLAGIYEHGNYFMSADTAIAYALYCLSAQHGLQEATKKIKTLELYLTQDDHKKAKKIICNFKKDITAREKDTSVFSHKDINKIFNFKKQRCFIRQWY